MIALTLAACGYMRRVLIKLGEINNYFGFSWFDEPIPGMFNSKAAISMVYRLDKLLIGGLFFYMGKCLTRRQGWTFVLHLARTPKVQTSETSWNRVPHYITRG